MVCSFRFAEGAAGERATAAAAIVGAACTAAEAECMAAATRTGEVCTAGCTGRAEHTPGEGTFIEETSTGM
jgi:hypothetical protein